MSLFDILFILFCISMPIITLLSLYLDLRKLDKHYKECDEMRHRFREYYYNALKKLNDRSFK